MNLWLGFVRVVLTDPCIVHTHILTRVVRPMNTWMGVLTAPDETIAAAVTTARPAGNVKQTSWLENSGLYPQNYNKHETGSVNVLPQGIFGLASRYKTVDITRHCSCLCVL